MAQSTTSRETVVRLKELLFDRESRELSDLAAHLAEIQKRAGSDEQFRRSVAHVLDGAMREAEASNHKQLADAMAPMVVRTLRTELKSPEMQDHMTGLIYPRLGEIVGRYVASAVRDMMQEINRRLESGLGQNRLVLRIRSIASGRSMAELALADTQRLDVEEIYLVRRGSGELIHHWQAPDEGNATSSHRRRGDGSTDGNRDALVSGFLSAITSFSEEAFEADKESMRTLDLNDHVLYLRGTPGHILAVKCSGSAPAAVEGLFDSELIRVLDEHQKIESATRGESGDVARSRSHADHERVMSELAARLQEGAAERTRALSSGHGARMLRVLAWIIGIPLLALIAWQLFVSWRTNDLQAKANQVIADMPALAGYPVKVHVERGGRRMWLTGLLPDDANRRVLLERLQSVAPSSELTPAVSVLPTTDVDAKVVAEGLKRAVDRALNKLAVLSPALASARERLKNKAEGDVLQQAEKASGDAQVELRKVDPLAGAQPLVPALAEALGRLRISADKLNELTGGEGLVGSATAPADATEAADSLVLVADRINGLVDVLEQRRKVQPIAEKVAVVDERAAEIDRRLVERIAQLEERLKAMTPRALTPRESLKLFIADNAVFFGDGTEYADSAIARKTLEDMAQRVIGANQLVRVVGYTDERGGAARNTSLSKARADKVLEDLVAIGVPRPLLVAVGRLNGVDLSPGVGTGSSNRRVEFEVGFKNEPRPQQ